MKTEDLEAFVAVVRCQSLSIAAETLHLTQSAITRRVQSLEEELGTQLFDRNTRPLKPTAMGLRLYEQSRTVLGAMATLHHLANAEASPSGRLRLGVPQSLGDAVLLDLLEQLRQHYPKLHTQVFNGWGNSLLEKLEHLELDAVAALFPAKRRFPDELQVRVLGRVRLGVVAAKGHWSRPPKRLEECHAFGWILNPDGCGFRAGLQQALHNQGLPLKLNLETFGTGLQLGLVARGMGLGLIPEPFLRASEWAGAVDWLPLTDFQPEMELCLIHHRHCGNLQATLDNLSHWLPQQLIIPSVPDNAQPLPEYAL